MKHRWRWADGALDVSRDLLEEGRGGWRELPDWALRSGR